MSKEQGFFFSQNSKVFLASFRQHFLKESNGTGSQVREDIVNTLEEELNPQLKNWAHARLQVHCCILGERWN